MPDTLSPFFGVSHFARGRCDHNVVGRDSVHLQTIDAQNTLLFP